MEADLLNSASFMDDSVLLIFAFIMMPFNAILSTSCFSSQRKVSGILMIPKPRKPGIRAPYKLINYYQFILERLQLVRLEKCIRSKEVILYHQF
ncbi:hypothetical protein HUJ04_012473 [Dendroctonus ponderosae]|nr:hypothetical protein HUJ04_012473 [Dendroctonus ponderosae]